jgi:hypothetical protein
MIRSCPAFVDTSGVDPDQRSEHLRAGADQVALSVISAGPPGSVPVQQWRELGKSYSSSPRVG